jgi:uncharacterized NAD(P)/FAD-binding protein YdhS
MTELEERVAAIRQELSRAVKSIGSTQTRTSKVKLIEAMRSDIAKLKTEGWTWKAISDGTKETLAASPELIRQVIQNKLKRVKKPTSSIRKRSKQEKTTPIPIHPPRNPSMRPERSESQL